MSNPTATPRTDAFEIKAAHDAIEYGKTWQPIMFARELETELAAAKAERDLAITRVASILWSGAIDKHTCGDVQKWVTDYTAELARLRAEVDKWKTVSAQMSAEREHNANQAGILRAEVERLEAEALRWSLLAKSNAQAGNRTEDERFNLFLEVKKLRAEQQAQQEINKPAK